MKIEVGRVYRAKKPAGIWVSFPPTRLVNDRKVLWADEDTVQYDGPAVKLGHRYPKVPKDKFVAWASHDCTDELPQGEYAEWPILPEG